MLEDGLYRVRVCVGVSRVIPRTLPYKQRGVAGRRARDH